MQMKRERRAASVQPNSFPTVGLVLNTRHSLRLQFYTNTFPYYFKLSKNSENQKCLKKKIHYYYILLLQ